jgi:hypothetical protein
MHGDSGSSDTSPFSISLDSGAEAVLVDIGAVCSVIALGSDGMPVALCTRIPDAVPVVHLLDPDTGESLASMELVAGSLLGGVYGYLDHEDRLVLVDGNSELLRIGHRRDGASWVLEQVERTSVAESIPAGDAVTSVAPDYGGDVWFATGGGTVGLVDTDSGLVSTTTLGNGERVANSISTAPEGMAVVSTHAVYLFEVGSDGVPQMVWRVPYDRGAARKPGQLSWGSGSTPTFFGPATGSDFVAFVDNADPEVNLMVVRTAGDGAGEVICTTGVFESSGQGSEDSPIGAGRSVFVTSTHGYDYPRLPEDAGPAIPPDAPFTGGMARIDVTRDASGCESVWESDIASAALPKLLTNGGIIVTVAQLGESAGEDPRAAFVAIDANSGEVVDELEFGDDAADPLQLAGNASAAGVYWQGTLGSVLRVGQADG